MVQLVGGGSSIWPKLLQKLLHIDQNIIGVVVVVVMESCHNKSGQTLFAPNNQQATIICWSPLEDKSKIF
jgi:hypothetical protein